MMDIAKSETFKNFIILNKALLFLIKLSKSVVQSVPKVSDENSKLRSYRKIKLDKLRYHFPKA